MTAMPSEPLITAEEFDRELVHQKGIELIDGRIVRLPMPGLEHGEVCMNAGGIVRGFVKSNRLGRVAGNDTFIRVKTNPARVRGADVLYISYARLPADQPSPKGMAIPPLELALEVKSPSDSMKALVAKANEYLEAGVQVAVVLNPDDDTATVFRAGAEPQVFRAADELTLPDILPGFAVRVGEFFE